MKRSVLLAYIAFNLSCLQAEDAPSVPTSLEGAVQSAIQSAQDENWCKYHPQECQQRLDTQRANEFKTQELQEKEGICERYPWRCESTQERKERIKRNKFCERFPARCKNGE